MVTPIAKGPSRCKDFEMGRVPGMIQLNPMPLSGSNGWKREAGRPESEKKIYY